MKQRITRQDFHDAFKTMGRDNQFTYEGRQALYENLAEFQNDYNSEDYKTLDNIREHTEVIEVAENGAFIILQF